MMGIGIGGYARKCSNMSSNELDTLGFLWGVKLANNMGIQNLSVEGDSMIVIKVVKDEI